MHNLIADTFLKNIEIRENRISKAEMQHRVFSKKIKFVLGDCKFKIDHIYHNKTTHSDNWYIGVIKYAK